MTKRFKPLAKGQVWKIDDTHLEIVEVGKRLAHYRLFKDQKRVPTQLKGIPDIEAYLKRSGAKLIKAGVPAAE
jgi:hypothetical protein